MNTLIQDLRYGLRMLAKQPGLTVVAVITLALSIGASTTIFSLVDALFYRPLPVQEPDRLVRVYSRENGRGYGDFAYPDYVYLRDHVTSFAALAAHYSYAPLNVVADGDSHSAQGAVVSANYFELLGARPLLGRFFLPAEDAVADRDAVAVLSFDYWQRRMGGDPAILGKHIRINGTDSEVVGVTQREFHGALVGTPNEVWIPSMMLRVGYRWCDGFNRDCAILAMIGRLADGKQMTDAQAEATLLAAQLAAAYPETNQNKDIILMRANGAEPGEQQASVYPMRLLMAVAGLLLLIACANVAGLLLVRGAARRKEIAIRLCLGAGRARLFGQLVTESMLLAAFGGGLGLIIALWAKDLLLAFYTTDTEGYARFYDLSLNPRVLLYSLALTTVTGLLFGLVPAIQSARTDIAQALKGDGSRQSPRHSRWRDAFVIAQVALSLTLLVAAGLLVRSAANVRKGMNFDPAQVALLRLRPKLVQYSPERAQVFTREVVRHLETMAGVESVSLAKGIGLAWLETGEVTVRLPQEAPGRAKDERRVAYHEIAPRFFETLKIPLLKGRDFDDRDRRGSPRVTIINETLAREMWPNESALDRVLVVESQPYQVVGVFKDARLRNALEAPVPFLYVPYWQNNFGAQVDSRLVVRVAGDPQAMLPQICREVASIDPSVPVTEAMPLTQQLKGKYLPVLVASSVLAYSSVIALLLCIIGLYSVLAFSVAQRTREIGIRMALGAQPQNVLKLVIGQGMRLAVLGLAVGSIVAFAVMSVTSSLLYGVNARDPLTFVAVVLIVVGIALGACFVPARRATRVDPMVALRYE